MTVATVLTVGMILRNREAAGAGGGLGDRHFGATDGTRRRWGQALRTQQTVLREEATVATVLTVG
jgi:hypothetical protein